jgi:hypothetical protein
MWKRREGVGEEEREAGIAIARLTFMRLDGAPDMVLNASPGAGGEGRALRRVEPQDRTPQTNATGLEGFFER